MVSNLFLEFGVGLGREGDLKHNDSSLFILLSLLGVLKNMNSSDLSELVESLNLSSDKLGEGNNVRDGSSGTSDDNFIVGVLIRDKESVGSSQVLAESRVLGHSQLILGDILIVGLFV